MLSAIYIVCKRVGAAAIAVLAVAALTVGLTGAAQATDGELHFTLVAVDSAPAANGVKHMLVLSGYGSFTANSVEGGGTYAHFDGASDVPKTMLGSGAWQANKVLRWTAADGGVTVGRVNPGVLDLRIDLIPDQGPVIKGATLRINCNVGFAGITNKDPDTGEPLAEGYWLTIPGSAFDGNAAPIGPFSPLDPIIGVTEIAR